MSRKRKTAQSSSGGTGARQREQDAEGSLRFTVWTALFGGAGVITAALGFYLLAQESITIAPVLLLLAFLVFFPLALVK